MTRPEEYPRTPAGSLAGADAAVTPPPRRNNKLIALAALGALLVGFGIGWGVNAWLTTTPSAQPNAGITVTDLAADPGNFYGSQVVVSAQISSLYNERALVAGPNAPAAAAPAAAPAGDNARPGGFMLADKVFVVGSKLPELTKLLEDPRLALGDVVQVIGTVHKLDVNDINSTFGTAFDNGIFGGFNGPVIYASGINLVPVTGLEDKTNVTATVNQILKDPNQYRNVMVTVTGTPGQRLSDHAFVFSGAGDEGAILVVTPNSSLPQSFTGTVMVHGQTAEPSSAALKTAVDVQQPVDVIDTWLGLDPGTDPAQALSRFKIAIIADNVQMKS